MNPNLLALLIDQVAIPELTRWLASRNGASLTDADVIQKLATDTALGEQIGKAWLAANPAVKPA